MSDPDTGRTNRQPAMRYRFGIFEADSETGELRRQGLRVRLHAQPFQLLLLLLERPGELLSREEIASRLWPDGTNVDFEHGMNSAINRLREALGDTAANPRYIETLARRGYRFLGHVDLIDSASRIPLDVTAGSGDETLPAGAGVVEDKVTLDGSGILARPQDLPESPRGVVQALFLFFQLMYLGFYVAALANLAEIEELLKPISASESIFYSVVVTAAVLIPVRAFAICAALFRAPRFREQFLKLWPFLLIFDVAWALSPFLLLHHINYGLAIACMALLVYSPFAQRAIVLMGAGSKAGRN